MPDAPSAPERPPDSLFVAHAPLDLAHLAALAEDPACGAVALFVGTVRSPNRGLRVLHIDYQGYEAMIAPQMAVVAVELRRRFDLRRLVIAHRLGRLEPGEASIVIAASSPHRGDALQAVAAAIDLCKERLPVWKYEVTEAGGDWVPGSSEAAPPL